MSDLGVEFKVPSDEFKESLSETFLANYARFPSGLRVCDLRQHRCLFGWIGILVSFLTRIQKLSECKFFALGRLICFPEFCVMISVFSVVSTGRVFSACMNPDPEQDS